MQCCFGAYVLVRKYRLLTITRTGSECKLVHVYTTIHYTNHKFWLPSLRTSCYSCPYFKSLSTETRPQTASLADSAHTICDRCFALIQSRQPVTFAAAQLTAKNITCISLHFEPPHLQGRISLALCHLKALMVVILCLYVLYGRNWLSRRLERVLLRAGVVLKHVQPVAAT